MAAAMTQGLKPACCPLEAGDDVVARATVVVVLAGVADVEAEKATTRFDEGANRRPAPTDGVGK